MNTERQHAYELLRGALDPAPPPPGAGRGIVTCASIHFARLVWILVRSLRVHGCSLPIELWHLSGEVNDPFRRLLEPEGVSFRLAPDTAGRHAMHARAAHALKPYAIAHSAFREVLFLDADNAVFRDPTFLFETPEFQRHRAIFWPDLGSPARSLGSEELRRDFGLREDEASPEFDSGQIVVDKVDRWQALAVTLHLNERSDYYYRFLYGDKETFRLAFDFVGDDYFLVPLQPVAVKGFVHFWIDSKRLFHHRVSSSKETLLTPRNVPVLPRTEARASLRTFASHWREITPLRDRLAVYTRLVRRGTWAVWYLLTHPRDLREAARRRVQGGVDWARTEATTPQARRR